MEKFKPHIDQFTKAVVEYAPSLIAAIFTLFIGLWIIKGSTKNDPETHGK